MRPQKLTIKNFMPFRAIDGQAYEINFSNLDLFAITGPTGSGKSSLIDAIVWCLYGRTARYGSDSKGVISAGEEKNVCEVALDFTVGSRWFRAVRRTGRTTESGLSESEGEEWIQDTSGAEQLTKRIEALLGLDFASFTKTVILPQGEYAQFLASKPGERRDLLAKILELGVYSRVADRAKAVAGQAKARADTIRETLTQYSGVSRDQIRQQRTEQETIDQQIAEANAQEGVLRGLVAKAERVATTLSRITELQEEERLRADEKELARQKYTETEAQVYVIAETLTQAIKELELLGYDVSRLELIKRTVAHLREYRAAYQETDQKSQVLAGVQHELAVLTGQITEQEQQVTIVRNLYQERAAAVQAAIAANGDIATLTEKLSQAKRWKELQKEYAQLTERQQMLTQRLSGIQRGGKDLVQQETVKEHELRELVQQRDRMRDEEQGTKDLEREAEHLGKELRDAVQEEKRGADENTDTQALWQTAEQDVQQKQEAVAIAEQHEQAAVRALEDNRRHHEAEHLRQVLHIGEPCPVCQTPVREMPLPTHDLTDDMAVLQRAVDEARSLLSRAREQWQNAHAAVTVARTKKETAERELIERQQKRREAQERFVSRFPGFSSLKDALGTLQTQRRQISESLRSLEGQTQALEKEKQTVTRQREKAQQEEARLAEELRGVEAQLASSKSQLDGLTQSLASYLSTGDDLESMLTTSRQALVQAQDDVKSLEQRGRHAEDVLRSLENQKVQKEGDLRVTISQRDAAAMQAERETQAVREGLNLLSDSPLPDLLTLENELRDLTRKQERYTELIQREDTLRAEREQTERKVAELRADLQARERVLTETQTKRSKAEQDLERARTELRRAIVQSGLAGIGPDGEGLKDQLAALHEQVIALRDRRSRLAMEIDELERRCVEKEKEEERLREAETEQRLATDLGRLLGAEFTDFLSHGAVQALTRDASVHLHRLTHGRYSFDIAYKRKVIELQIVDHEDHRRARPTHSLSGGETFLASLAIALALSQGFREVATGNAAKTSTECLILDEGFGTLDREGLQLVTETLQELRGEEGRMVGIITHVEEVAAAMPTRIEVRKGNRTSTVAVSV